MAQIDATLVFSGQHPEPERAAWIQSGLTEMGLHVVCRQYEPSEDLLELLYGLKGTRHVIVIFSWRTTAKVGPAFVRYRMDGHNPLPISCDDSPKYLLMADIVHADIFGDDKTADTVQLEKLVRAIRSTS